MEKIKKGIRIADRIVNWIIVLCFVPLLFYGIYAVWDSVQIGQQAESSVYEAYRPTKDNLSFDELKKINPEVFGWLNVYGTQIDYPLVQGMDNSKYVNTDTKGSFALSGSIFLDSRNNKKFQDINHVIYGHHMERDTMFGELEFFLEAEYFGEHRYGSIYYGEEWNGIEFFAFLYADAYDPVLYHTGLEGDEGRKRYQTYVKEHSLNYRDIKFQPGERYVTLSTCTSSSTNGRHLLIGRITDEVEKDPFEGHKDMDEKEKRKQE